MQEVYELRTRLKTCPFSEDMIFKVVEENSDIVKLLYQEFEAGCISMRQTLRLSIYVYKP